MASFQTNWTFREKATAFLSEAGLPPDFRYFVLFPQAISDSGEFIEDASKSELLGRISKKSTETLRVLQRISPPITGAQSASCLRSLP